MEQIGITHFIVNHIQNNAGSSCRNPIKFSKENTEDYVDMEYGIIKAIASAFEFNYTVKEQIFFISKRHRVYDIIKIEKSDKTVQKFCYEITDVFGHH